MANDIRPGDMVYVQTEKGDELRTKVQEAEDTTIWLYDVDKNLTSINGEVEIFVIHEDCMLEFFGRIGGNELIEGILVTQVERTTEITRIQRRNAYRLAVNFPVELDINGVRKRVRCINISEAGLGFEMDQMTEIYARMRCAFEFDGRRFSMALCVRRVSIRERNRKPVYEIGCTFEGIRESETRELRRLIFQQQRRRRR